MQPNDVRERWAERSGEYSPDYYAYYGPDEVSDRIRARLDAVVGSDAAVLELGCSSGRHLAHLHDHGYRDLHGVDINDEAFGVMADSYPDLHAEGSFRADAIERVVREFADDRFDVVYSVETLQHLHPDNEWVFDELTRITDDLLLTVENEGTENGTETNESGENGDAENEVDEHRGGGNEAGRNDAGEGEVESGERGTDSDGDDRGVNYVKDELPLYYRDWKRVFTRRGFTEVAVESFDRDTLRAFRPAAD